MSMEIKDELLDIDGIRGSKKSLLELFIRRTAVITSTPENLVEKIVKDQWEKANKILGSQTDVQEVDFCNLGTFMISPGKAKRRIKKLENHNKAITEGRVEFVKRRFSKEEKVALNEGIINNIKRKTKQFVKDETECWSHTGGN